MARKKASQVAFEGNDENQPNYSSSTPQVDKTMDLEDDNAVVDILDNTSGEGNDPMMVMKGQTNSQRREIRTGQRKLRQKLGDGDTLDVDEMREKNNQRFNRVRYSREAIMDGENLNLITKQASQNMDLLVQVRCTYKQDFKSSNKISFQCFHVPPTGFSLSFSYHVFFRCLWTYISLSYW